MVGGTSIGAVMATLVASDLPLPQVMDAARAAFSRNPTNDYTLLPMIALLKGRKLRRVVTEAAAATVGEGAGLEDLWKPCFCIATNYSLAREQVLHRGDLVRALRASTAIPGVLPPVVWDGELLCDGGTFNNFPADVMRRQRGVRTVIGVDLTVGRPRRLDFDEMPSGLTLLLDRLGGRRRRRFRVPSLSSLMLNATILYSVSRQAQTRALCDLYFNPPLERVGMLAWHRFDSVVARSREHAQAQLQAVRHDRPPALHGTDRAAPPARSIA